MRNKKQIYPDYSAEIAAINEDGISPKLITRIIQKHTDNAAYNRQLYERYQVLDGAVPIFKRKPRFEDANPINNKINNDFFSEIVDFKVGYFAGKAISYGYSTTYESENETGGEGAVDIATKTLSDFIVRNNMFDIDMETTKFASICGYSGRLFYIDPEGNERVMPCAPYETIILSNTDITEPVYALRYFNTVDINDNLSYKVEFYDNATISFFTGVNLTTLVAEKTSLHMFDYCPLHGIPNNRELIGDTEKVLTLIDEYDRIISDCNNEIESFANAYMVFENITASDDEISKAGQSGVLRFFSGAGGGKVSFLTKDINDAFTEHQLNRTENNIYRFSKTPKLTDETFGAASGVSLKFKIMGLETKCGMFQAKMMSAGAYMFKLLASSFRKRRIFVDPLQCIMEFKRNFPLDILNEAQAVQALIAAGLPKEVAFNVALSCVDDIDYVMQLIDKEINGIPPLDGVGGAISSATEPPASTLLNGAQITALMGIVQNIKQGVLSRAAAITLAVATLGISRENAELIIEEQVQAGE